LQLAFVLHYPRKEKLKRTYCLNLFYYRVHVLINFKI
jgi:hypothetical protein